MTEESPETRRSIASVDELIDAKSRLRTAVRRPSCPDLTSLQGLVASAPSKEPANMQAKSRFQRRELSIAHQGWLTKLSRGGLPNWNRRWFIQIGGSLYYSRSERPALGA